jgi:hypothetical protein
MFLDVMGLYPCGSRRCTTIPLDAGYVSVTSIDICQTSKTLGLHGRKLFFVSFTILILFLISLINLTVSFVWNKSISECFFSRALYG